MYLNTHTFAKKINYTRGSVNRYVTEGVIKPANKVGSQHLWEESQIPAVLSAIALHKKKALQDRQLNKAAGYKPTLPAQIPVSAKQVVRILDPGPVNKLAEQLFPRLDRIEQELKRLNSELGVK